MKLLLSLFASSYLLFANQLNELYNKALDLEKKGEYKKAMILYKEAFNNSNIQKKSYIKKVTTLNNYNIKSYKNIKNEFFEKNIKKSEDKEVNDSIKQILTNDFGLYPYKKNYLLPITYETKKRNNKEKIETKFQFSVEKPISYNILGLKETISFAYTQKSFWQTASESSPFRETNYQPEIFIQIPYTNSNILKGYKLSLLHESNGRNNDYSRSWNRIYLEGYLQYTDFFIIPRVWYRIPEKSSDDDNSDIYNYYGYGDLRFLYPYKKHIFELVLRNNLKFNSQNKGALELDWTFPLPSLLKTPNTYGFIQVFTGYGDSLIDYNKEVNKIGFGIALSR